MAMTLAESTSGAGADALSASVLSSPLKVLARPHEARGLRLRGIWSEGLCLGLVIDGGPADARKAQSALTNSGDKQ